MRESGWPRRERRELSIKQEVLRTARQAKDRAEPVLQLSNRSARHRPQAADPYWLGVGGICEAKEARYPVGRGGRGGRGGR